MRCYRIEAKSKLKKWPVFNCVVTDFCYAEIHAVLDAFNGMDIVEYLTLSYSYIEQGNASSFCDRYVKLYLCCSHLSKNMADLINKYFRCSSEPSKLIKEITAAMFLINDYNAIKLLWKEVVTLLSSRYIKNVTSMALKSIITLISEIEPDKISQVDGNNMQSIESDEKEEVDYNFSLSRHYGEPLYIQSPFYKDLAKFISSFTDDETEGPVNSFYCPEFLEIFSKKYLTFLPFWSNIFKKNSNRVSNSHIESYWKILKDRFHEIKNIGNLPLSKTIKST